MNVVRVLFVAVCGLMLVLSPLSGQAIAAEKENKEAVKEVIAPVDGSAASNKAVAQEKSTKTKPATIIPKDVNINTADKQMLVLLPGIGPVTADAILTYRKDNGNFKSIDELTKVKGIGEKTLQKIKPYLQAI